MAGKKPSDHNNGKKRLCDVFRKASARKKKDDRGGQGGMSGMRHSMSRAASKKSSPLPPPKTQKPARDIGKEALDMRADIQRRTIQPGKSVGRGLK